MLEVAESLLICGRCGQDNASGSLFCNQCGFPLKGVDSHYEDEQRVVSVLISDIVDSTRLIDDMGTEEGKYLIEEVLNIVSNKVIKFGGYVDKFLGDGILSIFGVPDMLENHPEKAILCGQEIQGEVELLRDIKDVDVSVRIVINTGEAIAGMMGSGGGREFTVIGEVVNIASRLEKECERGRIMVTANTYQKTDKFFDFEPLGERKLKGVDGGIKTYYVKKTREVRGKLRGVEGLSSPMVGRDEEMRRLKGIFDEVIQEEELRTVLVRGEPGVGKSRLMRELLKEVREEHPSGEVHFLLARSLPYGVDTSYLPIKNLLEEYFEIRGDISHQEQKRKIYNRLEDLNFKDDELEMAIESLMTILISDYTGEMFEGMRGDDVREIIFHSIGQILRNISQSKTVFLSFEDVQWMDETSYQLLEFLIKYLSRSRVFLFINTRPHIENESAFNAFYDTSVKYGNMEEFVLRRLKTEEMIEISNELLDISEIPHKSKNKLAEICGGNPFFLEEFIKGLIENQKLLYRDGVWRLEGEIDTSEIPDSISEVIMSRVDNLEFLQKRIIQHASVFGNTFWKEGLTKVIDSDVEEQIDLLEDSGIIERVIEPTIDIGEEYRFSHDLIYEVNYQSLLKRFRTSIHLKIAQWLEDEVSGDTHRYIHLLSHHFFYGGELKKALIYYYYSACKFRDEYSHLDAMRAFMKAWDIAEEIDEDREDEYINGIRIKIVEDMKDSAVNSFMYDEFIEMAKVVLELVKELGDDERLAYILRISGVAYYYSGDLERAIEKSQESLEISENLTDVRSLVDSISLVARLIRDKEEFVKSIELFEKALKIARQMNYINKQPFMHRELANCYSFIGEYRSSIQNFQRAIELGEDGYGNKFDLACAYTDKASLYLIKGNLDKSESLIKRSRKLSKKYRFYWLWKGLYLNLARVQLMSGKIEEALNTILSGLDFHKENFIKNEDTLNLYTLLSDIYILTDEPEKAIDTLCNIIDDEDLFETVLSKWKVWYKSDIKIKLLLTKYLTDENTISDEERDWLENLSEKEIMNLNTKSIINVIRVLTHLKEHKKANSLMSKTLENLPVDSFEERLLLLELYLLKYNLALLEDDGDGELDSIKEMKNILSDIKDILSVDEYETFINRYPIADEVKEIVNNC